MWMWDVFFLFEFLNDFFDTDDRRVKNKRKTMEEEEEEEGKK